MRAKILAVAIVATLLVGCGKKDSDAQSAKPVIGVSLLTLTNPFFRELGNAIKQEAEAKGYKVILTAGDLDIGKQKNQISDFIVQDVAAIIITPIDSKSIGTSIAEANRAGIPVFTADIAATAEGVVVLAKWLESNSDIIIFDEPTRGIDVGAKYEIYLLMNRLAAQGKTIIKISSELPEVLGMSDHILVMHEGRISGEIADVANATQERIMALAVK